MPAVIFENRLIPIHFICLQRQPLEVLCKKGCPSKFRKFQSLFGSLFLKSSRPATLFKEIPAQVLFCEICEIFKNTYFEEHPWATVSEFHRFLLLKEIKLYRKRSFIMTHLTHHWGCLCELKHLTKVGRLTRVRYFSSRVYMRNISHLSEILFIPVSLHAYL